MMYQQPGQIPETTYKVKDLQHKQADENYDKHHAWYSDELRSDARWRQFWRRKSDRSK
jgi:hypothetical protein